jgi:hypothetical protein
MLITAANDILLQKALYLADTVEIFTAYPGKSDSACRAQPLQGFVADFQKSTNLATVHPAIFRFFFRLALHGGYEFGNRIDFCR